jgi:hypothetical protein
MNQSISLLIFLAAASMLTSTYAQVTYDLQVDVVMDTVLYGGFAGSESDVPEGFRRYRLYAVIPAGADIMLGIAADEAAAQPWHIIPAFGYNADCGCYNFTSPLFAPNGYNNAAAINPAYYAISPELVYDT